ncbi:hypothetical protein GCM10020254_25190 [Streptomyces goshikiensis]
MSVREVRTASSPADPVGAAASRRWRRASDSTSAGSKLLPRPTGSRRLVSWPRLTYAYTVAGFTPSSSAACRVLILLPAPVWSPALSFMTHILRMLM